MHTTSRVEFFRIVAPHFVAGVEVGKRAAPIIHYMKDWGWWDIVMYCREKNWMYTMYETMQFKLDRPKEKDASPATPPGRG